MTVQQYSRELSDVGSDYNRFTMVYLKGSKAHPKGHVLTIETDAGVTGEWAGGSSESHAQVAMIAHYLNWSIPC